MNNAVNRRILGVWYVITHGGTLFTAPFLRRYVLLLALCGARNPGLIMDPKMMLTLAHSNRCRLSLKQTNGGRKMGAMYDTQHRRHRGRARSG